MRTKAAAQEFRKHLAAEAGGEVKDEAMDEDEDGDEDINPNLIALGAKEEPKVHNTLLFLPLLF